VAPSVLTAQLV